MSEKYFYDKFFQTIIELHEQIQLEQWPASIGPNGKRPCDSWTNMKQFFNFFVGIYIKYIYLMKRIEDSYDQIIHVQIRAMVKKFLQNIICRLVKVKGELIFFNNPILELKPCHYLFLDNYLIDLKLEPEDLELAIPRYFREEDAVLEQRRALLEEGLKRNNNTLPEEDKIKNFFEGSMKFEEAIEIIKNFELARQHMRRIGEYIKYANKKVEENMGTTTVIVDNDKIFLQQLVAIQIVKQMREDELKFLKMKKNSIEEAAIIPALNSIGTNLTELDEKFSNLKSPEEVRKDRKQIQKQRQKDFEEYQKDLENKNREIFGYDLKQKMLNERRDWIEKYKQNNRGEPPQVLQWYYDQFKVTIKKELDDNQKKEKDKIAKDKLKKEQDKKKKSEQGDKIVIQPYTGPSGPELENIQKEIENFKALFETPSEFINQRDDYIEDLAKKTAIEKIEETIRKEVDEIITAEIANRRTIFLKGKKDKIKKVKPPKPPAEKFCTGEKPLSKLVISDLFNELIDKGVIRKMVPKYLDDLICDFNYVASRMNIINQNFLTVPLFYTKQLIKEYLIFPLGDPFIKENMGTFCATALFHGPPGTGKTHAAIAVAYHTNSLFFDISPRNIEDKIKEKSDLTRIMASIFRVAKNNQPAVIYFDQAELIFPVAGKAKGFIKNPTVQKMKKFLVSMKSIIAALKNQRVLIIGCTNRGQQCLSKKDLKTFFEKTFYFGLPSYSDRIKLWKTKIAAKTDQCDNLDYSTLGEMSNGYSQESIISCIDYVLSKQRLDIIKPNPIETDEFISALSKTQYVYKEDNDLDQQFLNNASGMQAIYDYLDKKREENEKNTRKK